MISNRKEIINNQWLYRDNINADFTVVNIPHTNKEIPYNYFHENSYQFISNYKKSIKVTDKQKRIFINFEGVMTAFELFINKEFIGEYKGGYIPHFIEVTDYVKFGEENEIYLEVDSTEREDIPPFGHVIDYLTYGGIYRDVYLYELNKCFVENILYDYKVLDYNNGVGNVAIETRVLINNSGEEDEYCIEIMLNGVKKIVNLNVASGTRWYNIQEFIIDNVSLWSVDSPKLYKVHCNLLHKDVVIDDNTINLGFRDININENGFYLNGENVKIFGLNRHQSYPYVGYAMPKRVQEKDADILKDELALNLVRTSHYPQSKYFLDRCDEIGLLVLEEIPGWQHISKSEVWRNQVLVDVEGMILRDYNHPSIITWGVRINESLDDDDLYSRTNELARSLDKTRKTCGIRCIEKSNLLEDIYTMNDFIHSGGEEILRNRKRVTGLDNPVPYMVTEFCGHIYPTKKFDQEERIVEHALRHGRIQSKAIESEEHLGAIGWCAFDYNTHYDFGSGDRICYHGVMDMFRIPKFAGNLYKSQKDVNKEAVLEPLTYWARGERNMGQVFPVYVCTNCEEIELRFGGRSAGIFKRDENTVEENLKHLKYSPIKVVGNGGEWGDRWAGAEFIGYVNGKEVIRKKFCANPVVSNLLVEQDHNELKGNEFDATRIVVKVVDEENNILPYATGSLSVSTCGDIEIIGPKQVSLIGGSIAFWVKTLGSYCDNKAKVNIESSFEIAKTITIELV